MTSCPNYQDDPSISDTATIWRRINEDHQTFDNARECQRMSSQAFSDSSADNSMSVTLAEGYTNPESYLQNFKERFLAAFPAKLARNLQLKIVRQPTEEDPHHAIIIGRKSTKVKRAFYKHSSWVIGPENGCPAIPIE